MAYNSADTSLMINDVTSSRELYYSFSTDRLKRIKYNMWLHFLYTDNVNW